MFDSLLYVEQFARLDRRAGILVAANETNLAPPVDHPVTRRRQFGVGIDGISRRRFELRISVVHVLPGSIGFVDMGVCIDNAHLAFSFINSLTHAAGKFHGATMAS